MKPRVNNPAWVQRDPGRDRLSLPSPIRRTRSTPIRAPPPSSSSSAGTGAMRLTWWGDVGSNARTSDTSVVGDVVGFSITAGRRRRSTTPRPAQWDKLASGPNFAPNMAYLGWGVYVMAARRTTMKKQKAAWSAAAHLGGKDISLWMAAYPSGFQPYRNSPLQLRRMGGGRLRPRPSSRTTSARTSDSYNHPNAAIEPRIPGIFQYYSIAEDELAKGFAGQYKSAQERRRRHRRRLGEDHRPDRPRQARSSSTRPRSACLTAAAESRVRSTDPSAGGACDVAGQIVPSRRSGHRTVTMRLD